MYTTRVEWPECCTITHFFSEQGAVSYYMYLTRSRQRWTHNKLTLPCQVNKNANIQENICCHCEKKTNTRHQSRHKQKDYIL